MKFNRIQFSNEWKRSVNEIDFLKVYWTYNKYAGIVIEVTVLNFRVSLVWY